MLKISSLLILFSVLTACSGGDDVVQALKDATPPPATIEELGPKNVSSDVPAVAASTSYHGKKTVKYSEEAEFDLVKGLDNRVVDIEYKSLTARSLTFGDMTTMYMGNCKEREQTMTWMELRSDGSVIDSYTVGLFDSFEAEKGGRYILRIHYSGTAGCDRIYNLVSFQ